MEDFGLPTGGGEINPTTLRLKAEEAAGRQAIENGPAMDKQIRDQLAESARFIGVSESEAAAKLMKLVEDSLFDRIEFFLTDDDQCQMALTILNKFKIQGNVARRAAVRLVETGRLV